MTSGIERIELSELQYGLQEVGGFLHSLGLSEVENRIYLHIVQARQQTALDIAKATGIDQRLVRDGLENLEAHALVARTDDRTPRYFATPPATALEALALLRKREVDRALTHATDALTTLNEAARPTDELIEIVNRPEALTLTAMHATSKATSDVMVFSRPPFIKMDPDPEAAFTGWPKGVRVRYIFDQDTLETPGFVEHIETTPKPGEELRVVPRLPMKLVIVDKQIAFLPLSDQIAGSGLIVRASTLVEMLNVLFEKFWEEALPVDALAQAEGDEANKLLSLLASGLTDESIAKKVGISTRSLRRRIARLQQELGARNRFQAGAQAVRRGRLQ